MSSSFLSVICIAISLLPSPSSTQSVWVYPQPNTNPTFKQNDILEASWTSDFHSPYLTLLCDFDNEAPQINKSVPATGSTPVPLNHTTESVACHLNLQEVGLPWPGGSLNSPNFNIVAQQGGTPITWNSNSDSGPTTLTTSTATSTTTPGTTSVSLTTTSGATASTSKVLAVPDVATKTVVETQAPPTVVSIPPNGSSSGSGLTTSAIIGVSIGAGVGAIAFVGAIVLFLRARRGGAVADEKSLARRSRAWWPIQEGEQELHGQCCPIEVEPDRGRHEVSGQHVVEM